MSINTLTKKEKASFKRAEFYHEAAEVVWLDVKDIVDGYFKQRVFPEAKKAIKTNEFPKSGLTVFRMARKRILKVLEQGMKDHLV